MKRQHILTCLSLLCLPLSGCGENTVSAVGPNENGAIGGSNGGAGNSKDTDLDAEWDPGAIDDPDADAESINDWVFETDSELTFDDTGRMKTFILGDVDFFTDATSLGFYHVHTNAETGAETTTHLSEVTTDGDDFTVSAPDGSVSFSLRTEGWGGHVALHLLDMTGIDGDPEHTESLRLYLEANESVSIHTLNDLVAGSRDRAEKALTFDWPYLWGGARPSGSYGSFVLYDGTKTDSDLDATLAEIWAVQGTLGFMVHPAGQPRWTRALVLAWVERWAKKFEEISTVYVAAQTPEELYEMTDEWVLPSGVNRVYMFSSVWRGQYVLGTLRNEDVAGKSFPGGEEDLLTYSEYLDKYGIHLQLKSLVPSLPRYDEAYFSDTHCEDRFLSWGSGTLTHAIDTETTTIQFQPGPDYVWEQSGTSYARIGNELVSSQNISIDPATGVWTLVGCERGVFGTSPHEHNAGDELVGVAESFNFLHHADDYGQPSSLADEILEPYGDFLNRMNVGHLHFDGTSSDMREAPWYTRTFLDKVYSRVDQPVTGSRVGGTLDANFERKFPMAEQAAKASTYWNIRIGLRLQGQGGGDDSEDVAARQHSPGILDLHFDVSDRILKGGRRPSLSGGRSGGSLTMEMLDTYGLTDEAYALFLDWIELAPVYDDADEAYVADHLIKVSGDNHFQGEDVLVLGKNGSGQFTYTPHRIMGEADSVSNPQNFVFNDLIKIDQEWGAVLRYQSITPGTTMTLENPYGTQQPQVVFRVDPTSSTSLTNPLVTVNGSGILSVTGTVAPGEYMKFEGGSTATLYDENWNVLDSLPVTTSNFSVNNGDNTVTTAAGGSGTPSLWVQYITLGDVYVLESNKHL